MQQRKKLLFTGLALVSLSGSYAQELNNWSLLDGAVATQESTTHGGVASRAIDGNTNPVWQSSTLTHTASNLNVWWQVDLGEDLPIEKIVLFNRDVLQDRLSNFSVTVTNSTGDVVASRDFYTDGGHVGDSEEWSFTAVEGKVVRIERIGNSINGNNSLTFAEVQVLGTDTPVDQSVVGPSFGVGELKNLQDPEGIDGDELSAVVREFNVLEGAYQAGSIVPLGAYDEGTVHKLVVSTSNSESSLLAEFSVIEEGGDLNVISLSQSGDSKIELLNVGAGTGENFIELAIRIPEVLGDVKVTQHTPILAAWSSETQYDIDHFTSLSDDAIIVNQPKGDISMGEFE